MKKFFLAVATLSILAACNNAPEGQKAETSDAAEAAAATGTTYSIDTVASVVEWLGTKPVGTHNGSLKLSSGSLAIAEGTITGGNFIIDVTSLTDHDMKGGEGKEKLEAHLKSADFLEVEKYPTAKFEISAVEVLGDSTGTHKISGNLTLKDSTKNITFPANVTISENEVSATANFNIDRTQWGLFYGNDKSLGDKFIHPEVNITLNIKAVK